MWELNYLPSSTIYLVIDIEIEFNAKGYAIFPSSNRERV
jgi:hypothetical protein